MLECRQGNGFRLFANIFGVVVFFIIITGYTLTSTYAAGDDTTNGATMLEKSCNTCHEDTVVRNYDGLSAKQWETVIARMQVAGATISDNDKNVLAKYLSAKYK